MELNIRVFGSTSYGNATLIWDSNNSILIDCGFSVRYTQENLKNLGLDISSLSGVFLTHTHTDHIKESMMPDAALVLKALKTATESFLPKKSESMYSYKPQAALFGKVQPAP
jgi:metal-dependent hydrolase (beta-lactamase superfamily II)